MSKIEQLNPAVPFILTSINSDIERKIERNRSSTTAMKKKVNFFHVELIRPRPMSFVSMRKTEWSSL